MRKAPAGVRTIDDYLAALPAGQATALERLRQAIRAAAPGAEESFYYGMPAFRFEGRALVAFAAAARHCALYPLGGRAIEACKRDLSRFDTSKGTIRFQPDHPLPLALIRKLVRVRIAQNREKGAPRA